MVEEKPQGETLVIDGHSHIGIPPDWMSPENFIKILDDVGISQRVSRYGWPLLFNSARGGKDVIMTLKKLISCQLL